MSHQRHRVLVAGGGVGALEAVLALQDLASRRLQLTVLAPNRHFSYRALSVGEPFGSGEVGRCELGAIADARGFRLVRDALSAVRPDAHEVVTQEGSVLPYDTLLLALGARPAIGVSGALTFRGAHDAPRIATALSSTVPAVTAPARIAFAAPDGASWTLPLYELALLTARWAGKRALGLEVEVVTPEPAPLWAFGSDASETVCDVLRTAGIRPRLGTPAESFAHGQLVLTDGASLPATAVVALARLEGPAVSGLPQGPLGFLEVDDVGRARGVDGVYAIGDMTARTVKLGGLAAPQAEVTAKAIALSLGVDVVVEPYRPVLRGLLLTGCDRLYLRSSGDGGQEAAGADVLWWPPHKVMARRLGAYLAAERGPIDSGGRAVSSPG